MTCSQAARMNCRAQDPAPATIRMLVADDHQLLTACLKTHFRVTGSIEVVATLRSTDHLIEEARRLRPDVILLEVELPGPDVFETTDRLRHILPGVPVVFLSDHVSDGCVAAASKSGAAGYFSKSDDLDSIIGGIIRCALTDPADREFLMGAKVRQHCLPARAGDPRQTSTHLDTLSQRELEVLRLIGQGKSRIEVAHELCRSPKTIDGHQDRIMHKLGIDTRSRLMRYAIHEGLAEA